MVNIIENLQNGIVILIILFLKPWLDFDELKKDAIEAYQINYKKKHPTKMNESKISQSRNSLFSKLKSKISKVSLFHQHFEESPSPNKKIELYL